jgi:hypothetical protein
MPGSDHTGIDRPQDNRIRDQGPEGRCWLPTPQAQLYVDGEPVEAYVGQGQMAVVEPKGRE